MNKRQAISITAAVGAALLPVLALAQTDASTVPTDNASNTIGALVAWLLAGGGIITGIICTSVDKSLRSRR